MNLNYQMFKNFENGTMRYLQLDQQKEKYPPFEITSN